MSNRRLYPTGEVFQFVQFGFSSVLSVHCHLLSVASIIVFFATLSSNFQGSE